MWRDGTGLSRVGESRCRNKGAGEDGVLGLRCAQRRAQFVGDMGDWVGTQGNRADPSNSKVLAITYSTGARTRLRAGNAGSLLGWSPPSAASDYLPRRNYTASRSVHTSIVLYLVVCERLSGLKCGGGAIAGIGPRGEKGACLQLLCDLHVCRNPVLMPYSYRQYLTRESAGVGISQLA